MGPLLGVVTTQTRRRPHHAPLRPGLSLPQPKQQPQVPHTPAQHERAGRAHREREQQSEHRQHRGHKPESFHEKGTDMLSPRPDPSCVTGMPPERPVRPRG